MDAIMIILIVMFVFMVIFSVVSGVHLIKQDGKKNRNLRALFLSYDKAKQVRILRLKNDIMDNNDFMGETEALELAMELEKIGWRKEFKIDGIEVYL